MEMTTRAPARNRWRRRPRQSHHPAGIWDTGAAWRTRSVTRMTVRRPAFAKRTTRSPTWSRHNSGGAEDSGERTRCAFEAADPFRSLAVLAKYLRAEMVSSLVTFNAAFFYISISYLWADACDFYTGSPILAGVPFFDAYRYLDRLLTVLQMFADIHFALNSVDASFVRKSQTHALGYALRRVPFNVAYR